MYCTTKYFAKLSLPIILLLKLSLGWKLPPVKFLSEFAKANDRTQLSISIPFGIPSMNSYFRQLTRFVFTIVFKSLTIFSFDWKRLNFSDEMKFLLLSHSLKKLVKIQPCQIIRKNSLSLYQMNLTVKAALRNS